MYSLFFFKLDIPSDEETSIERVNETTSDERTPPGESYSEYVSDSERARERFPQPQDVIRHPFDKNRYRDECLIKMLVNGYYFHKCPCEKILQPTVYQHIGCICRLLFYGVKIPYSEEYSYMTDSFSLRFFKGSRHVLTDWEGENY